MALIEAIALSVRYPTRRAAALSDLNLTVRPGERLLLAGPSGGGKSTLALCLNGLIPHSLEAEVRGQLLVDGQETRTARPEELAARVGLLFQDPSSQFTMLTVEDEIAFGLENLGVPRSAMESRITAALTAVGMVDYRQRRLDRLSGGQQQRVALAGLLAMEPAVLVLDEPTAHLDPLMARQLHSLLAELAEAGRTLVIIEHQLEPLLTTLGRVVALDRAGQRLLDAPLRTALTEAAAPMATAGVRLPAAVQLGQHLAAQGIALPGAPLTIDEGAAARAAGAAVPPYATWRELGLERTTDD